MLTRNLWVEKGLYNGSMGVVRGITYQDSQCPPSLPLILVVEFGGYAGSICSVPIVSIMSKAYLDRDDMEQTQLHLRLCRTITVHKSQWCTLNSAKVDLGVNGKVAGMAYVGISWVKSVDSIIIETMSYEISFCEIKHYII